MFVPILYILRFFNSFIDKRYLFELRNLTDPYSRSFKEDNQISDFLFEVASEGELEQILPVLNILFSKGKKVELIYSSPSVEKKIQKLNKEHSRNLRSLRLSLLFIAGKNNLFNWVTAKKIILCRYDFYPELFLLGLRKNTEFILLSATLKNKTDKSPSFFKKFLYNRFDKILLASNKDIERFSFINRHSKIMKVFDFRIIQINKRKKEIEKFINSQEKRTQLLWNKIQNSKIEKKIIFGSFWEIEHTVFDHREFLDDILNSKVLVMIAPHILKKDILDKTLTSMNSLFDKHNIKMPIYIIENNMNEDEVLALLLNLKNNPGILISLIPGVLVEFYQLFNYAFIGGGHGRSIHSLLEPYLLDNNLFCGPKVFRSTEYDFVFEHSPESLFIIEKLSDFYSLFKKSKLINENEKEKRRSLLENSKIEFKLIMKEYFDVTT